MIVILTEPGGHASGAEEWLVNVNLIDDSHQLQVHNAGRCWLVVQAGTRYLQQFTLPFDARSHRSRPGTAAAGSRSTLPFSAFVDDGFSLGHAQRLSTLDKKSRSTVNSPIFACNSFTRASSSRRLSPPLWNTSAALSSNCRFQALTWFACTPYSRAISAVVRSFRAASNATFAFHSGL